MAVIIRFCRCCQCGQSFPSESIDYLFSFLGFEACKYQSEPEVVPEFKVLSMKLLVTFDLDSIEFYYALKCPE